MKTPKAIKLPSGRWRVSVQINGIRYSITKDTKKDAEKAAVLLKMSPEQRAIKMTYREAIDAYILKYTKELSPSTIKGYRDMQRQRFQNVLDMPIGSGVDWQDAINREDVSPKTLKNAYGLISKVCRDLGIEPQTVRYPPQIKKERSFLDVDQIKIFCEAIEGDMYELPYLLCLHSLRRSEMLALKKSQVKDGVIHVQGAIVLGEKGMVYKESNKTDASTRHTPIFIPRLATLINSAPEGILCPYSVKGMENHLRTILRKAGLPVGGFHILRHSFASLCYFTGVDPLTGMKIGGWSDYKTMMQIYTHLAERQKKLDVSKLVSTFAPNSDIITE